MTTAFRIPDSLVELDQWVLWRYERQTKVPYAITGRCASSTDPATWSSFEETVQAWNCRPNRWSGIGFVFADSDPFVGIDLDDCLDEQGMPKPWAQGIVERFADTYCEISPSGNGLKIWCRGILPVNVGKVAVGDGGIEMYSHARFFTVTGRAFRGAPLEVEDHESDVAALCERLTLAQGRWRHQPKPCGKIPYGRQHCTLVSIAGTLARRRVCLEAIEACLQVVNARQCERPGPSENISRIARSAARWITCGEGTPL
ncbi:MAG: primase C-terminal domain-containing protein [Bryobacteraceae bacterium]